MIWEIIKIIIIDSLRRFFVICFKVVIICSSFGRFLHHVGQINMKWDDILEDLYLEPLQVKGFNFWCNVARFIGIRSDENIELILWAAQHIWLYYLIKIVWTKVIPYLKKKK